MSSFNEWSVQGNAADRAASAGRSRNVGPAAPVFHGAPDCQAPAVVQERVASLSNVHMGRIFHAGEVQAGLVGGGGAPGSTALGIVQKVGRRYIILAFGLFLSQACSIAVLAGP